MDIPGIQWTNGEAAAVNEFLNSPVGRKWLGVLLTRRPHLDLTTTERAALTGSFAAGYDNCFNEIARSRVTAPPEQPSARGIDPTRD